MHVGPGVERHPVTSMKGPDSLRVALHILDLILGDKPDPDAIGLTSRQKFPEDIHLRIGLRYDKDSAFPDRHTSLRAVLAQLTVPLHAVLRLQRSWLQVVTGMDDTGVPSTLMQRGTRLLFENQHVHALSRKVQRDAHADSSGADDRYLYFCYFCHVLPMVGDSRPARRERLSRRQAWQEAIGGSLRRMSISESSRRYGSLPASHASMLFVSSTLTERAPGDGSARQRID